MIANLLLDLILIIIAWRIFLIVSGCLIKIGLILFVIFIFIHLVYLL